MTATALEKDILRTVCWFALFSRPVTSFEIWKWLFSSNHAVALEVVDACLNESAWLAERLQSRNGFYTTRDAGPIEALMGERHARFLDATNKYKQLRRAAHWFQLLPGVRAVAAVNTIAHWSTDAESDIDLFVVVRPGTIWSSRFLSVFPFLLSGRRPNTKTAASDRAPFCFSFFVTTKALNLDRLRLDEDPYFAVWISSLVPIVDKDGVFDRFLEENTWAKITLPHVRMTHSVRRLQPRRLPTLVPQPAKGWVERWIRQIQIKRFPDIIHRRANTDTCVVVSDHILKFHQNDRRAFYRNAWQIRLNQLMHASKDD